MDRYQALGMPYPDPSTMCAGDCEGTGYVPIYMTPKTTAQMPDHVAPASETDPTYIALWEAAEMAQPSRDGWHMVICTDCHGTGQRP